MIEALRMMGRCADGAERDSGRLTHAVPAYSLKALCGVKPGRRSAGWAKSDVEINCLRCLRKRATRETRQDGCSSFGQ